VHAKTSEKRGPAGHAPIKGLFIRNARARIKIGEKRAHREDQTVGGHTQTRGLVEKRVVSSHKIGRGRKNRIQGKRKG